MNKYVENVRMLQFSNARKEDGKECFLAVEGLKDIPFEIKRIFYIFGGDRELVRGKHANRKSQFVLFNVSGTSKVKVIDENRNYQVYNLDAPNKGIFLPEMVWKEMYDFSEDSILMVLTNEYYDSTEYIRSFDEFVEELKKEA